MASADYTHSDIAGKISGRLAAIHSTDMPTIGATWTEVLGTEFAVTMDNGQRFVVTVRPY